MNKRFVVSGVLALLTGLWLNGTNEGSAGEIARVKGYIAQAKKELKKKKKRVKALSAPERAAVTAQITELTDYIQKAENYVSKVSSNPPAAATLTPPAPPTQAINEEKIAGSGLAAPIIPVTSPLPVCPSRPSSLQSQTTTSSVIELSNSLNSACISCFFQNWVPTTNYSGVDFANSDFTGAQLSSTQNSRSFRGSIFSGGILDNASLASIDARPLVTSKGITPTVFDCASAQNSILTNAQLSGASLKYVNFSGANLQGAHLGPSTEQTETQQLYAMPSTGTCGSDTTTPSGYCVRSVVSTENYGPADITGANFNQANLMGAIWVDGTTCQNAQCTPQTVNFSS